MDRGGDIAGQEDALALGGGRHRWNRGEQNLSVGMLRRAANGAGFTGFHHTAEVHNDDALAEVFDDGEVVRNEQVGEATVPLDVLEEIDHLGLDADVECADRFVTNDQTWFHGEGTRDADALSLSATELVGETARDVGGETDLLQKFMDPGLSCG